MICRIVISYFQYMSENNDHTLHFKRDTNLNPAFVNIVVQKCITLSPTLSKYHFAIFLSNPHIQFCKPNVSRNRCQYLIYAGVVTCIARDRFNWHMFFFIAKRAFWKTCSSSCITKSNTTHQRSIKLMMLTRCIGNRT